MSRWRDPRIARALAGLGAAALFGSLVGEWITLTWRSGLDGSMNEPATAGPGSFPVWGTAWVVGVPAILVPVGLSLLGPAHLRVAARAVGLAVTGAMLMVLVAITMSLEDAAVPLTADEVEARFERGLYLGYLALALCAAALWLAGSPHRPPAPPNPYPPAAPGEPAGPGEVTVAAAEPFVHPADEHGWR